MVSRLQSRCCLVSLVAFATVAGAADPTDQSRSDHWLGFRGDGTSASVSSAPTKLSLGDDGNLAWQLAMPGRSVSGPIVVGEIVVTTGSSGPNGEVLHISGVDLTTGKLQWEQTFRATGRPYCHPLSANAAPTPVSDGEHIFAFFSSSDLICLSLEGDLIWYRGLGLDYPKAGNDVGMASSPVIADGAVIVQVEAQADSFAIGIDVETGQNLWHIDRPKSAIWCSPIVIKRPGDRIEVILQSRDKVVAVDPRTGKSRWESDEGRSPISSPTATNNLLLLPGDDLAALNIGTSGSEPPSVWRNNKLAPRNASVVATDQRIYSLKGSVLVAGNISDGEVVWRKRLSGLGGTWATPVIADGKLYLFDQKGVGLVIEDRGDDAETINKIELDEPVLSSPAIAAGRLIVRGIRTLYCFE